MSLEEPNKEKSKGRDALLSDIESRSNDLNERKRKGWIKEEEYVIEKGKLEEERLDVLTNPDLG